jgi:hypothetical protein
VQARLRDLSGKFVRYTVLPLFSGIHCYENRSSLGEFLEERASLAIVLGGLGEFDGWPLVRSRVELMGPR